MKYISTRGKAEELSFSDVLLTGLASDGGLYVPKEIPQFSAEEIRAMQSMSYSELAVEVVKPFVAGDIPENDLRQIITDTYADFRHQGVAPLVQLGPQDWVLELFHGPTIAFKDYALQLLGRLLDYVLEQRGEKVVIMGATSGDTGSAAIEGTKRCKNIDIFILHPYNRVSDVQRRQMTTVAGDNIHNIALKGNFDHCQDMVKASFADQSFLPEDRRLVAVNSINWARIMAQIVYYFWAGVHLGSPDRSMAFSVPTGNFGDIFAGYMARQMGLPIEKLVIATNENDILHRTLSSSHYERQELVHTLSPSMDITISSNFERLLFDLYGRDGDKIDQMMEQFKTHAIDFNDANFSQIHQLFASHRVDDEETLRTMEEVFEANEYLLDPHSAIGYAAAKTCPAQAGTPMITLATAHPAKFPDACRKAGQQQDPALPHHLLDLFDRKERFEVLENDIAKVHDFIQANIKA